MVYKQYFKRFLTGTILMMLSVVALNILIDPLDVFRVIKIQKINLYKTDYSLYARLAKPMQIERHQPDRLALGSSRVFLGIPMDHGAWSGGTGFNAGMNGGTIKTVRDLFEHAYQVSNVKDALISTDLFMFNVNQLSTYPNALAHAGESEKEKAVRKLSLLGEALFSPDIILATLETMRKQGEKYNKFLPSGQTNPEYEKQKSIRDSYISRFVQFEDSLARIAWSRCRDNQFPFAKDGHDSFAELDRVLELAAKKNIRLRLFVSPIHARALETMSASGFWGKFEEMKIQLVDHVERMQEAYPQLDVQVWDFSGYNTYSSEPIPEDPAAAMRWYYDSSHFTDEFGGILLDNIYLDSPPQSFGLRITSKNIKAHLENLRMEQRYYRDRHREQFDEINARVMKIIEDKKINGDICDASSK